MTHSRALRLNPLRADPSGRVQSRIDAALRTEIRRIVVEELERTRRENDLIFARVKW